MNQFLTPTSSSEAPLGYPRDALERHLCPDVFPEDAKPCLLCASTATCGGEAMVPCLQPLAFIISMHTAANTCVPVPGACFGPPESSVSTKSRQTVPGESCSPGVDLHQWVRELRPSSPISLPLLWRRTEPWLPITVACPVPSQPLSKEVVALGLALSLTGRALAWHIQGLTFHLQ